MTQPDWSTQVPWADVNNPPATSIVPTDNHMERLIDLRGQLIEMIIREILQAFTGFFAPGGQGPAFDQLQEFAEYLSDQLLQIPILGELIGANGEAIEQIFTFIQQASNPANWLTAVGEAIEGALAQIAALQAQLFALQNPASTASQFGIDLALWTNVLNTLAFSPNGNYLQTLTPVAAYRGTGGNVREPATDKQFVQVEIDAKQQGLTRATFCGDSTFSNYAGVDIYSGFDGDYVALVTGSSPTLTVIRKQADFLVPKLSDKWVFEGRYDPATNTFYVLRNGVVIPALTWVDSTNYVTHGAGKRKVGVVTNVLGGGLGQQGPAISKFIYGDWTQPL